MLWADLLPGTKVNHKSGGHIVVLDRRFFNLQTKGHILCFCYLTKDKNVNAFACLHETISEEWEIQK